MKEKAANPDVAALERFLVSIGVDEERDPEYAVTAALLAELLFERTAGLRAPEPTIAPIPYRGRADEIVGMDSIRFYGLCPHHLVPYVGEACVRIIPGERIAGAGALARAVREIALTPRLQESMTQMLADIVERDLAPVGLAVRVVGRHFCMELKGSTPGARLVTEARRGATITWPQSRSSR
ncbi:MAG TPA: GTP cyclohydrolase I [Candidatus Eisenbacteria bacterium]|nr:GTP cyclohydrolase I [Candidatus Eisenbacteria bacterium]